MFTWPNRDFVHCISVELETQLKVQMSTHTIERWADSFLGDLAGV